MTRRCQQSFGWSLLGLIVLTGCSEMRPPTPRTHHAAINRRQQTELARTQVSDSPVAWTASETSSLPEAQEAYQLNRKNIILMVYELSPRVRNQREGMVAAQIGLTEFITNLSRLEPFVNAKGGMTDFPERRQAEGMTGELVGGIEKETYDGAIIRFEGGISGEHVKFGEVGEGQEEVESGSGGLFRARLEVPFAGSRKRVDRIISQAFQESSARKAVLDYVSRYRTFVVQALNQYRRALLFLGYQRAYLEQAEAFEVILADPRVHPEDHLRLESAIRDSRLVAQQYDANYQTALYSLLQFVGLSSDEPHQLEESLFEPSWYFEQAKTEEGREGLLAEAFNNNPTFQLLEDAIADTELQRDQAIAGVLDVTAFLEATQFAFGSTTFDDRVGGWQVGGGVTVRVNDQRVLSATRKKTEAQIRGFRADIEMERIGLERDIATNSDTLISYAASHEKILTNLHNGQDEFQSRLAGYFDDQNNNFKIDDVIRSAGTVTTTKVRLASNDYSYHRAEDLLLSATGEVYRLVGMEDALVSNTPR